MKRILIGLSGCPSSAAKVDIALGLAKRFDASITLASVFDVDRLSRLGAIPIGGSHYAKQMREERLARSKANAEAAVTDALTAIEAAGVPVHVEMHHGDPMAFLCDVWRYHDLCLLGVRGWFDHGVMAEPDAALTSLAGLGVRPILAVTETARPIRRALIAYNGTLTSAKAMKRFTQLQLWPDVEIHLAVFEKPEEAADELLRDAKDYLEAYGLSVKASAYKGGAKDGILTTANAVEADLIVMGTASYQSLRRKIFGDVTGYVIKNVECPVFLAH